LNLPVKNKREKFFDFSIAEKKNPLFKLSMTSFVHLTTWKRCWFFSLWNISVCFCWSNKKMSESSLIVDDLSEFIISDDIWRTWQYEKRIFIEFK